MIVRPVLLCKNPLLFWLWVVRSIYDESDKGQPGVLHCMQPAPTQSAEGFSHIQAENLHSSSYSQCLCEDVKMQHAFCTSIHSSMSCCTSHVCEYQMISYV